MDPDSSMAFMCPDIKPFGVKSQVCFFFFSSRRRHTRSDRDWSSDVCSSDLFYGGGTPNTGAFTIPNTAASLDAGVPAGNWKFVVNDYAYECAAVVSGCNDGGSKIGRASCRERV